MESYSVDQLLILKAFDSLAKLGSHVSILFSWLCGPSSVFAWNQSGFCPGWVLAKGLLLPEWLWREANSTGKQMVRVCVSKTWENSPIPRIALSPVKEWGMVSTCPGQKSTFPWIGRRWRRWVKCGKHGLRGYWCFWLSLHSWSGMLFISLCIPDLFYNARCLCGSFLSIYLIFSELAQVCGELLVCNRKV